jgi:hypothetical protein
LLAPSIPFRFFATAVLFQGLAWLALFWAAPSVPRFAGGLGWPLASLHLFTLGVLMMTAIGASLQLLPVATRQAVPAAKWPYDLVWSLYTAGVVGLTSGMASAVPTVLMGGAIAVASALLIYLFLLARNLRGARGMRLVVVHGWAACGSLLVLLGTGLSLAGGYSGLAVFERQGAIGLHVTFAGYGFMGMLVMGFSCILVPMFALSGNPAPRWANLSVALAIVALALTLLVSLGVLPAHFYSLYLGIGAVAFTIHVALMLQSLRTGMRQGLGKSFVLVRLGWAGLGASFLAALALDFQALPEHGPTLFGMLLVGGLLTVLLGVLSRIVPFLASMHAGMGRRRPPTPAGLTAQRPLDIHFYCHTVALALLLLAAMADSVWLVRASALLGLVGAAAFGVFFVTAWRRMTQVPPNTDVSGAVKDQNLRQIN